MKKIKIDKNESLRIAIPKTIIWDFDLKRGSLRITKRHFDGDKPAWRAYLERENNPKDFGISAYGLSIRDMMSDLRKNIAIVSNPRAGTVFKRLEKK